MEESRPFISVIIPTYERAGQLSVCLGALAAQDYPRDRFEVLVIDDGSATSPEASVETFRHQLNVRLLKQPHAGPAAARNYGAAHAKGAFLAFTDDDCAPAPGWLQSLATGFVSCSDCVLGGRTINELANNPYSTVSQLVVDYLYAHWNSDPEHASRPFDADRDGFIVGEGAGILILESLEHATQRNAPILAEIVGYGMSGDAYHITQPVENGDGAFRVMRAALKDAKLSPDDISYVNAHGTSTPIGDVIETTAMKRLFGERAINKKLPVSSTKSMTGHLLGGAGGLEAGISVLALRDQILPPTINQFHADPKCDLDYVPNVARKGTVDYALSNSFGFGGTNAALIFKRWAGK